MSERVTRPESGDYTDETAVARHIEAAHWWKQVNRRMYDQMSLPT
jgi:hypothetical protein